MVGHIELYNPVIMGALSLVEDGSIGDLRSLVFNRAGPTHDTRIKLLGNVIINVKIFLIILIYLNLWF